MKNNTNNSIKNETTSHRLIGSRVSKNTNSRHSLSPKLIKKIQQQNKEKLIGRPKSKSVILEDINVDQFAFNSEKNNAASNRNSVEKESIKSCSSNNSLTSIKSNSTTRSYSLSLFKQQNTINNKENDNDDEVNGEKEEDEEKEDDEDEEEESDDDDDDDNISVLEFEILNTKNVNIKSISVCSICELSDQKDMIDCQGSCQRSFHRSCYDLKHFVYPDSSLPFKCSECSNGIFSCFICKTLPNTKNETKKCSVNGCGRYFHDYCFDKLDKTLAKVCSRVPFICPSHACKKCLIDAHCEENEAKNCANDSEPKSTASSYLNKRANQGRFVRCIRCPTVYHANEECLVAGSIVLGGNYIICPNHFKPMPKEKDHRVLNVAWCFACCKFDEVICCSRCPASYHYDCIDSPSPDLLQFYKEYIKENKPNKKPNNDNKATSNNDKNNHGKKANSVQNSPSSSSIASNTNNSVNLQEMTAKFDWICDDCQYDKRPTYGEIVWAKVGYYRYWPAQVVHPRNLPVKQLNRWHIPGEFPVKFFGTFDYYWINIGRCFSFAEADDCHNVASGTNLQSAFVKGVEQAKEAFMKIKELKKSRAPTSAVKNSKYNFQYIRTNKPYGNVVVHRLQLSDYPHCDCDPKSANPCGTDDCVNRVLKYECHPALCPAGDRCQNQRFVKRQYPKQEPINTGSRGWGLIAKTHMKKGDFVNEYVGELIDDEECKRRLNEAHEKNITNFYFLTIDKDRIIDAGPKGNFARFMNHSCDPNVQTQKWMVNGDVRVGLFALKDIEPNSELTFNYNLDCLSNEKAKCRCGSANCSGFIGERPKAINGSSSSASLNNQKNPSKDDKKLKKRKLSELMNESLTKANKTITKEISTRLSNESVPKANGKLKRAHTISVSDNIEYEKKNNKKFKV